MEGSDSLLLLHVNELCDEWIEAVYSVTSGKVGMLIEMFGIEQHNLLGGPEKSSSVNTEFDSAGPSLSTLVSALLSIVVIILMFGIDKYGRILGGLSDWSFWCSVAIRSFGSITLTLKIENYILLTPIGTEDDWIKTAYSATYREGRSSTLPPRNFWML